MSALTPRLGLTLPGGGSSGLIMPPDPVDIDVLNNNFSEIDNAIGFKVVTSTTRPSTPFDGQPILETDTGLFAVYRQSGAIWQYSNNVATIIDVTTFPAAGQFEGRIIHVDTMNVNFQAIDGVWMQQGYSRFATTADRDTEYAKASAAYLVAGALALTADKGIIWRYNGTVWQAADTVNNAYATLTVTAKSIPNSANSVLGTTAPDRAYVEVADTLAWHDPTTNPERVTPTIPGRYRVLVVGSLASNATGNRQYRIGLNGVFGNKNRVILTASADSVASVSLMGIFVLNGTTDYLSVDVFQNSGGALNTDVIQVDVEWIGP